MNPGSGLSFPALGTTAVVLASDPSRLRDAERAVRRTVADIDLACSRFREDSQLSWLNAAAGSTMRVGPLLLEAVLAALRAARLTDGDVDPTIGRALIALGYDRDFAQLRRAGADARAVGSVSLAAVPGWRAVLVDPARSTIRLPPGVRLDLGATAKALAADQAAAAAHALAGCAVLVALGGDIALAGPSPGPGWRVRVTDDHRDGPEAPGQWITLHTGGLATSSTTVRRWRAGTGTAHHLIDPATGAPAAVIWRTVSVAAGSCLDANIASTAAIIRGERAAEWLESLKLPSRLVGSGGTVRHLAGWPAGDDELPAAVREPQVAST